MFTLGRPWPRFTFGGQTDSAWSVAHLYSRTGTGEHQPVLWFGPPARRTVGTAEYMCGLAGVEHRSLMVGSSQRHPHYTERPDAFELAWNRGAASNIMVSL